MSWYRNNIWLFLTRVFYKFPDQISCNISIHFWHIAVHQYEFITVSFLVILLKEFNSFETVVGCINSILEIEVRNISRSTLQNNLDGINIIWFIVNNHHSADLWSIVFSNCIFIFVNFMLNLPIVLILCLVDLWQVLQHIVWKDRVAEDKHVKVCFLILIFSITEVVVI